MLLVQRVFIQGMGMQCSPNHLPEQDEVFWKQVVMASLHGSASCSQKPLLAVFGNAEGDSVGMREHQRDEICAEGTQLRRTGRSSAWF